MTSTAALPSGGPSAAPRRSGIGRPVATAAQRRRNRRVEAHRELVPPLALHYARRCQEPWDDLFQVGMLGLIRAAELYRPEQGTPFQAFARPHIRGAILHYLRDEAPSVRLPRRQAELQERLQRLEAQQPWMDSDAGTNARLRDRLGVDETLWTLLIRQRMLCRAMPLEEAAVEQLAAPEQADPEERLVALRELLDQLDPRQRQVVRQVVLAGWSYRRLAAQMQISPMTVQRLLQRGLAQLRQQLEQREIRTVRPDCRAGSEPRGC